MRRNGQGLRPSWLANEMGAFFLPEVGDEVIVAFDHGDINYPYVLGVLMERPKESLPRTNDDGQEQHQNAEVQERSSDHF